MKRGELWTLRGEGYASKPRPVVIIQANQSCFDSIILCLITSFDSSSLTTRVQVTPSQENNLLKTSYIMTEKIVTVDKALLGKRIGALTHEQMRAVTRQLTILLGIKKDDLSH